MREIKFRAWDIIEKKFVDYGFSVDFEDGSIYDDNQVTMNDVELMQYTGLKDKNGKEIYEFDQLKGDWDVVNDICLGTVEFYGGAFRIKETGLPLAWADKDKDCEVVGNKFDGLQNPSKGDIM